VAAFCGGNVLSLAVCVCVQGPQYVNLDIGSFVCTTCSGMLRRCVDGTGGYGGWLCK
jgi:hypothetical protein